MKRREGEFLVKTSVAKLYFPSAKGSSFAPSSVYSVTRISVGLMKPSGSRPFTAALFVRADIYNYTSKCFRNYGR